MNPKLKKNSVLNLFIERYSDIADLEKEKLLLQAEVIAVYTELCLSTVFFERNNELKLFHDNLFFNIITTPLLDYLYKSRTQLLARSIREIYKVDLYTLKTLQERLIEFLNTNKIDIINSNNPTDKVSKGDDFVDYWTTIIDNKGK